MSLTVTAQSGSLSSDTGPVPFPQGWIGRWEGPLAIHPQGSMKDVTMALEIGQADSLGWPWTLLYLVDGQEDRREYFLQPVNSLQGRWQIDERNGIVLGCRYLDRTLWSVFGVEGQLLQARYGLEGEMLRFEILGHGTAAHRTGGQPEAEGKEAVPEVNWYEVVVFQQALLRKVR